MQAHARDEYLVNEVHTAPPQKLQLLLLEAVLRFAEKARSHWSAGEMDEAGDALCRCQDIVTEIMAAIQPVGDKALAGRVSALYAFVFRCLVQAHLRQDETALLRAIQIIEIERETWQQVCNHLGTAIAVPAPHGAMATAGLSLHA